MGNVKPEESPTVMATDDAAVLFTRAFRIGFKITKPESQNTGMDTTQPIISIARTGLFFPTSLITKSASLRLPLFSPKWSRSGSKNDNNTDA